MNLKAIYCGLFGCDFNETHTKTEPYNGKYYVVEERKKCEMCGLWDIDDTGGLGLYNLKYNENIERGVLKEYRRSENELNQFVAKALEDGR